jgi:hypothetical protein
MKSNFRKPIVFILALLAIIGLLPLQSQALIFYESRADMPANDFVDWGSIVSHITYTNKSVQVAVCNPFSFTSVEGYWLGNFAPGDPLLVAYGKTEIAFSRPLSSVGAQIQSVVYGSFIGTLEAFDANHVSLGSFSTTGYSSAIPNTATFMGVVDPLERITYIDFSVSDTFWGLNIFAINRLNTSFTGSSGGSDPVSPAPLPGSLLLCGSSLLGLAGWRYRKF